MNGVIRITDPAKLGREARRAIKQIQQWDNGRHLPNAPDARLAAQNDTEVS